MYCLTVFHSSAMPTTTTTHLCQELNLTLYQCPPPVPLQSHRPSRPHPNVAKAHATGLETQSVLDSCARSVVSHVQVAVSTQLLQWLPISRRGNSHRCLQHVAVLSSPFSTPLLSPVEGLQIAIANMDPTVQFMCSVEASTQEANLAHAQELADEAKGEANYQAAIAASLGHSPPHNNTHLSPTDFASTSHISSSHIGSSLCVVISCVASSHTGPLSLICFTPSPPASPPKAPKHKTHLHSEWMQGYKDKTSQPLRK